MTEHHLESETDIKLTNELSDIINKDTKNYRFKFCDSITIYSFLGGIGVFNDHWKYCVNLDNAKCQIAQIRTILILKKL